MPKSLERLRSPMIWASCLVVASIGLRTYHYVPGPSMWHDEAYLVLNVLGKSFQGLLGPLFFSEAAPPLFLWLERAVALVLGDSTHALRLLPFLASCAVVVLMVPIARRALSSSAAPWAVLLVGFSDHLVWHACEAKPYAVDALASAVLIALFVFTDSWNSTRRLVLCALVAPFVIFLSYPGCFLCGGLLVALLPGVWRKRTPRTWFCYGLLILAVFGAFAALRLGPIRAQRCEAMDSCWLHFFPPWERPWAVPGWTLLSFFEVFRYCFEPAGQVLVPLALLGGHGLWQRGRGDLLLLLVVPILLALVAACLLAYPFGGARVLVYAAPALALLIAEGTTRALTWLREQHRAATQPRFSFARPVLILLLLVPLGRAVQRAVTPWKRADCGVAAAHVLANRRPGDAILSNHPEYLYYFRQLGPVFRMVGWEPSLGSSPGTRWGAAGLQLREGQTAAPARPLWCVTWDAITGEQKALPAEGRLWVVLTGASPPVLLDILRDLPLQDWQVLGREDFALTSVFLLERKSEPARSASPVPSPASHADCRHDSSAVLPR